MREIHPKEYYDVVIIGAGISGLTSSALFRRAGLSCCVVEMNNIPGGFLQGFNRHSYRFDSAIHWLNNCGPNGFVTRIFKIIGQDYPKSKIQKRIKRFVSNDFDYLVSSTPDDLKEQWIKDFPHEKKGIVKFFKDAKRVGKSMDSYTFLSRSMDSISWYNMPFYGLKMLKFALPFIPHIKYDGAGGVERGLDRYFKDTKLKKVFCSEPDMLSCLIPIGWAYYEDFQTPPPGGSQSYPEWLAYVTEYLEGDIFYKSKVLDVLVENNTAVGVRLDHRGSIHEVKSKYVIAACDAETLYDKMLPKNTIPEKIMENLKGAKLYASGFTVALGLDCLAEELGLGEEIVYLADPNVNREELGSGDPHKSGIHIVASTTRDKSLALPEHGTITLFIAAWIEQNNYWNTERDDEGNFIRGEKYKALKQEYADILIDRVQEKVAPNLRAHISYCDIATPITHQRYTGNKNGSMMGQRPGKENMQAKVAGYKTPVKNLLRSGHWADLGGGVPIAVKSAMNTTFMVLKKENKKVFRLLAKYMDGKIEAEDLEKSGLLTPYDLSWVQELTPAQKTLKKRAKAESK